MKFDGEWKEGIPEGHGKYYENGKVKYEGEWKRGVVYSWNRFEWFDYQSGEKISAIGWLWNEYLWIWIKKGYFSLGLMIFSSIIIIVLATTGKYSCSYYQYCLCDRKAGLGYYLSFAIAYIIFALLYIVLMLWYSYDCYVISKNTNHH